MIRRGQFSFVVIFLFFFLSIIIIRQWLNNQFVVVKQWTMWWIPKLAAKIHVIMIMWLKFFHFQICRHLIRPISSLRTDKSKQMILTTHLQLYRASPFKNNHTFSVCVCNGHGKRKQGRRRHKQKYSFHFLFRCVTKTCEFHACVGFSCFLFSFMRAQKRYNGCHFTVLHVVFEIRICSR